MRLKKYLDDLAPWVLSVLRIVVGFLYIQHGTAKLFHFPVAMGHHAPFTLLWMAGVLEVLGGFLILVGLFTRYAAFILSGEMAFAYFIAHAPRGFWPLLNHGEAAVFYCFVFLYFVVAGGGALSFDRIFRRTS